MNQIHKRVWDFVSESLGTKKRTLKSHMEGSFKTPFGYTHEAYTALLEEEISTLEKILEKITNLDD